MTYYCKYHGYMTGIWYQWANKAKPLRCLSKKKKKSIKFHFANCKRQTGPLAQSDLAIVRESGLLPSG